MKYETGGRVVLQHAGAHERRPDRAGMRRDHGVSFDGQPADHERDGRLRDPCLLGRDGGEIAAEIFLVVDRDGGDRRDDRPHQVRRVEAPAEPDLDHADVDPEPREPLAGEQRDELEVRERDAGRFDIRA